MDAGGHEEIGKDAGEELLKKALEEGACPDKGDETEFRITAFPLGNWLTDISQVVDTQLYRKIREFTTSKVNMVADMAVSKIEGYESTVVGKTREFLNEHLTGKLLEYADYIMDAVSMENLKQRIVSKQQEIVAQIDMLFLGSNPGDPDAGQSELADALQSLATYMAYFRFVFSTQGNDRSTWGMDYPSFLYVMEEHFTQYYPYEHQDRPADGDGYDARPSEWKKNDLDSGVSDTDGRDCYEYLRENIQVNAAKLAAFDRFFASYAFNPKRNGFRDGSGNRIAVLSDSNPEFNLHLANLGRTLHSCEDFFAHTNFVDYISDENERIDELRRQTQPYKDILKKRKRRWTAAYTSWPDNWRDMPPENDIVSGYFDFIDTVISLLQKVDSLMMIPDMNNTPGDKVQWIADETRGALEYDYKKLFTDSILLIQDPGDEWDKGSGSPDSNDKNSAAELLKQSENLETIIAGLEAGPQERTAAVLDNVLASPMFEFVPEEIKQHFRSGVDLFVRGRAVASMTKSLFDLIVLLKQIYQDPLAWIRDMVQDQILEMFESWLVQQFYLLIGMGRVGCHSLIAKDDATDLFYDAAMHCAKSVHYQAMHVFMRHLKTPQVTIGSKSKNTLRMSNWVDWLHFLEYFLDNPYNASNVPLGEEEYTDYSHSIYITEDRDTLDTIADMFLPTCDPGIELTWREIALENGLCFGDEDDEMLIRQINETIEVSGMGTFNSVRPDDRFFSFIAGIELVIPYQEQTFTRLIYSENGRKIWWKYVINDPDGWLVMYRYGENGTKVDNGSGNMVIPHGYRMLPVTFNRLKEIIQTGRAKQRQLERAYRNG